MSDDKILEIAKEYVDKQLETMKKYGSATEVSESEYRAMIEDVASTLQLKQSSAA